MKTIAIICEGKTEHNYIQALDSYIWNEGHEDITLIPIKIDGCRVNNYLSVIHDCFAKNLRQKVNNVFIWLDKDIFVRAGKNIDIVSKEIIAKAKNSGMNKNTQTTIIFNTMNGEDMMMLHENEEIAKQWYKIMQTKNHFSNPLVKKDYEPLVKTIYSKYKKNQKITLDSQKLKQFINNNNNQEIAMQSDIVDLIKLVLSEEN
ncbi:hypothetical protein QIW49_01650 [Francisellaceae bacterium CB300]